ncbi:pilus assembly FimT family protein [Weissella soli]|uniref:pilus assembly FimT family protein n=1 Tax=Weissella soli TaxID=155866 RepID=UPI00359FC179
MCVSHSQRPGFTLIESVLVLGMMCSLLTTVAYFPLPVNRDHWDEFRASFNQAIDEQILYNTKDIEGLIDGGTSDRTLTVNGVQVRLPANWHYYKNAVGYHHHKIHPGTIYLKDEVGHGKQIVFQFGWSEYTIK